MQYFELVDEKSTVEWVIATLSEDKGSVFDTIVGSFDPGLADRLLLYYFDPVKMVADSCF